MNPTNDRYNPADDDNQGVAQLLSQGEAANSGVSQIDYMNPVENQGPEPVKEEVNESDVDANGINDDVLVEEKVEAGDIGMEEEE